MSNKQQQNTELKPVILASTSPSRRSILKSAGIVFTARSPDVDEDILKKKFTGSPKKLALMLAEKKALSLSSKYELALVIGADQVLSFKGDAFNKPKSLEEAKKNLKLFRGKTHKLESATAIAHKGKIIWRHEETPKLTMRNFSNNFLEHYIESAGEKTLLSSGGYSIEREGAQIFSKVKGDFFSIIGLPLIPLLQKLIKLKSAGVLE